MKKFLLPVLITCFIISALPSLAESWDDFSDVDRLWDGQKSITNQQFEQVMDKLEKKNKQKEEKLKQKKTKKTQPRKR